MTILGIKLDPRNPGHYLIVWGIGTISLMALAGMAPKLAVALAVGILLALALMLSKRI